MLPIHPWARDFSVESADVDFLMNTLLEKETPLSSHELALLLIEERLKQEREALEEQYKNLRIYQPAENYAVGDKLIFPAFEYARAVVTETRPGDNPDYGDFSVITVEFEDSREVRHFATDFSQPHSLNQSENGDSGVLPGGDIPNAEEIFEQNTDEILDALEEAMLANGSLAFVAGKWFPRDLLLEMNDGHLNLAEAVLDMAEGGPLTTDVILEQIGGLGNSPQSLQVFSANYMLNEDSRFDEVGPAGEVMWFLTRMEPEQVRSKPEILHYSPVDFNPDILTDEMITLIEEAGDELSPLKDLRSVTQGTISLIYPHRRSGTLPLNYRVRHIFPTARRTNRIWVTLVDANDGEEFIGWVVPRQRYVYGLEPLYLKYSVPVGAYVTVSTTDQPDRISIYFNQHKARTEWIRLLAPKGDQLAFENTKRPIGTDYDDLMILGADDLAALDQFLVSLRRQKPNLAALMRMVIPPLGRLTPQGTVHVKTIYSAVNVLRRCPPGPILATLVSNPDFESVGGDYWKLSNI